MGDMRSARMPIGISPSKSPRDRWNPYLSRVSSGLGLARMGVRLLVFAALLWSASSLVSIAAEPGEAVLRVHAGELAPYRIPRELTGKFCEHLGANIYNGMDSQILSGKDRALNPAG